jgi:hypothetical protein
MSLSEKQNSSALPKYTQGHALASGGKQMGRIFRTGFAVVLIILVDLRCALALSPVSKPGRSPRPELTPQQATRLADLMCRQLPNVTNLEDDNVIFVRAPKGAPAPAPSPLMPSVVDDVVDTLKRLGHYSLPCLTSRLMDTGWMPDPRGEPLLGHPAVGDVAYTILMEMGVKDLLWTLGRKPPHMPGMYYHLWWPTVDGHRRLLQGSVRAWIAKHPHCCGGLPVAAPRPEARPRFQMSPAQLRQAQAKFARLRPGVTAAEVLKIAGKPDAIDPGYSNPEHERTSLLTFTSDNRNEDLAYIYFVRRWTEELSHRDPLRDRYVIVYFSKEGKKMTRMFSNVAEVPPIFPHTEALWMQLICGPACKDD